MDYPDLPINPTEVFDIVGIRKDGAIDTVVVCHGPLDNSATTLRHLDLKIRNYLREIATDTFAQQCGSGPVRIFVSCNHAVSAEAEQLINDLANEAAQQRVLLLLGDPVA